MEPLIDQIYRLLEAALQANMYHDIRRRYASSEQWAREEESVNRSMHDAWFRAKAMICENKNAVQVWLNADDRKQDHKYESINAAMRTIEAEMSQRMEDVITEDDNG